MKGVERALIVTTAVLLGAAIVMCWNTSTTVQSFTDVEHATPWPLVLAQTMSWIADILALVGLASGVGLLFLRAARWPGKPAEDEELTPQPSP